MKFYQYTNKGFHLVYWHLILYLGFTLSRYEWKQGAQGLEQR